VTSQSIRPPASNRHESITLATRICTHGPVRAERLNYTLSGAGTWGGITNGIWNGGTTPRERAQPRRQHQAVAA
jgi:hypothetical protein